MLAFLLIVAFPEIIQSAEEHAYQQFIECAFNTEAGQVDRSWSYGFDGRDIMHVDLANETMVATSEPGKHLAAERQTTEYMKKKEEKLNLVCSAVKTVFLKSNNSLSRAAKPSVYISSGGERGQEYLKCVVYGFYPNVIRVRWTQKERPIYYGVSNTGILPHRDGTFQITSYLSLGNVSAHDAACEIEHTSIIGKLRETYGEKSLSPSVLEVLAAFLALVLPVCFTVLIILIKHKTTKPPDDITNDTSDESEASLSLNVMNISQES